ncbi:DNA circularization protein [Sideroxydans lithotrophicus]|uniref:DNA circulation family protein n=1 Tax=Sideroxydans lithotrophicus (strain ES-1) TaxID=580332 RepID=D5CUE7_SIDLE|nr:DNA circularization N-terminal domain-containing protein [Sideroxydans lithotrophicus]ADE10482.1 DNA circulation family protein [Sideroxydans lithotrophicus ES-1]
MAWEDKLLDASFRGIKFEVVKTDDDAPRSIVEHAYPYVNGSDVEDMGRGARRISLEAVFYGDDYETRLQEFLDAMDQPGAGEFIHPVFGSIKNAQPVRYPVHHDAENPDYATVAIEFIESTPGGSFFEKALPAQKAEAITQQGAAATVSASEAAAKLIERLQAYSPLAPLDTLREAMTGPLLYGMDFINTLLSGMDVLAYPRAWGNDISALVNGALDVRLWGDQLEADWASIQSDLHAFSIFSSPPAVAPAQVTSTTLPSETQAVAAIALTVQVNTAVGLANAASFVLASESVTPTLQPDEIEAISNTARTSIQNAIEQARITYGIEQSRTITEPLKGQGLAVQEAARAVIAARPPLIQRAADAPGNMRLLAHLWYGDNTRAPELYRLNGARSPFVNTGDSVNAYAR